jgi:hypothetical protein
MGVSPDFKLTGNSLRESNQELLATEYSIETLRAGAERYLHHGILSLHFYKELLSRVKNRNKWRNNYF